MYKATTLCLFCPKYYSIDACPTRLKRIITSLDSKMEYWMIYRGLGFLAVVWKGSSHLPSSPPPPVSKLYLFFSLTVFLSPVELTDGRGGEGRSEEKAWPSINPSILSVLNTISVGNGGAEFIRYKCRCLGWFSAVLYLQESTVRSLPPIQK